MDKEIRFYEKSALCTVKSSTLFRETLETPDGEKTILRPWVHFALDVVLPIASIMIIASSHYQRGLREGRREGRDDGISKGVRLGYERGLNDGVNLNRTQARLEA